MKYWDSGLNAGYQVPSFLDFTDNLINVHLFFFMKLGVVGSFGRHEKCLECLQKTIVQWWKCTNQTIELGHFMLFSFFLLDKMYLLPIHNGPTIHVIMTMDIVW
jgi:hypothetical protein